MSIKHVLRTISAHKKELSFIIRFPTLYNCILSNLVLFFQLHIYMMNGYRRDYDSDLTMPDLS